MIKISRTFLKCSILFLLIISGCSSYQRSYDSSYLNLDCKAIKDEMVKLEGNINRSQPNGVDADNEAARHRATAASKSPFSYRNSTNDAKYIDQSRSRYELLHSIYKDKGCIASHNN